MKKLKIIAISDTHGRHRQLNIPDGDILIHSGDITGHGELEQVADFNHFLGELPHPHKLVIAGNHDLCFERDPQTSEALLTNCTYLLDTSIQIEGVHFYGSPWQPWFFDWAFNLHRGAEIRAKWNQIPTHTDVLITHGPPINYGDRTFQGKHVGCADLLEVIEQINPRYHLFGHIHEGYGIKKSKQTTFINASSCNMYYEAVNAPIVFEITL